MKIKKKIKKNTHTHPQCRIDASVNRVSIGYSAPIHYLNQCWVIVNQILRNKLKWNFIKNAKRFIHENASDKIVCEMAAILSRGEIN